jgi:HSP20 family protein
MSRFMNGLLEGNGRTNQAWVPALDVWETDSDIVYALDLPGIAEEKISVELDDGALTISAERERTQEDQTSASTGLSGVSARSRARSACRRASLRAP